ncbi:endonuclease domain-containing protein [Pseudomonas turukhanskensis]|uniref:Endonuclease n=1 Tax=Pseudomonas turukhanskensis TaxID=1806536 RepID=A0A9W6K8D7_9PSED|nr:endonuclease domain-containing protein [Pseudomonas turukhanskensis]GLK90692.1 endonuclease [Pseudomonas turukhanskensis]
MDLRDCAKGLRSEATEAERAMWYRLRDRRFMGLKFRRQVPLERYIADFVCWELKLIVELDGGQHIERAAYDQRRSQWLAEQGYTVLRYWNNQVLQEMEVVLEAMRLWVEEQKRPSPPAPLPQAGEGRQA